MKRCLASILAWNLMDFHPRIKVATFQWDDEPNFYIKNCCFIRHPLKNGLLGVSKNRGTPKWMVKIMENPIKMGDLGGTTIFGNTQVDHVFSSVL